MSRDFAVTVTGREEAQLLPVPRSDEPLGPSEVAGPTLASLVSAGTELNWCYLGTAFPSRPGYAAVFRVEEVGADVRSLQPGDSAICLGGHQTWQRCPAWQAPRIPDSLSPADATFARLMCVSMSTVTTTSARPPQLVVIMGLGLVGHLAARVFASCGYEVIGCDPSAERRSIAVAAGVPQVFGALCDAPGIGGRAALVLECSGTEQAALDACRAIRKGGEVVLVGTPWRRYTDLTAFDLTHAIFHQYAVVRSGWEWELPLAEQDFRNNSIYGNIAAALRWLAEGRIDVAGLYELLSPREAQRAYQGLLHGTWPRLAAVFDWRGPQNA